ncbi:MAG: quinone oxidoreductase family protein [Bryobacteraceae bacterium]
MKAVVADQVGGPENLRYIDLPDPQPAEGEAVIKVEAIGVNFIDVYFRKGLYKVPESPIRLGSEASGVITSVGRGVSLKVGQRVAYAMARGAYAEYAAVPAKLIVPLPDSVSFEDAAAIMLQGMTAHYLLHSTFPLQSGQTCLVHAAAGGTGLLLVQIAKLLGATVLGTASTEEKAQLARENGADHLILYTESDFVAETKKLTGERGVDVVYDSVGADTFARSLECLRPRGMMVSFGNSSGPVDPVEPLTLSQKGSLFLTRPNLANYISDAAELNWRSSDLFNWIDSGKLKTRVYKVYSLREAAAAHRDLEGRKTSGKLLLKP